MAGRVEGKVAFITGAARGQGRSHAVRLAQEGADIIAVDVCEDMPGMPYAGATQEDLAETVKEVEALDRRIVAEKADVRDYGALKAALDDGIAQLGRLDIVSANAGIGSSPHAAQDLAEQTWQDMLDINLTGVWHTAKAATPHLIEGGHGGSIVLTSSAAGLQAYANIAHYVSAKHGVVGLMRTLALELAPHSIRVNSIHHPGGHANDPERGDVPAVPARPGPPHPGRFRARVAGHERASDPLGGPGRHQQRGAVPGLRRGPLHHRGRAAGGRRGRHQVASSSHEQRSSAWQDE
jgi:SDR family mycofactocin-dependent oxidoreductase